MEQPFHLPSLRRLIGALLPECGSDETFDRLIAAAAQSEPVAVLTVILEKRLVHDDVLNPFEPAPALEVETLLIELMGQGNLAAHAIREVIRVVRDDRGFWEEFFGRRLTDGNEACPYWRSLR